MRLRRLLKDAFEDGGRAVLLHGGTVRFDRGPDTAGEFTAAPLREQRPVCRWCLHWKSEHRPHSLDDESTPSFLARLRDLHLTSCFSDFEPLAREDRVICTRCSQHRFEHPGTGSLEHEYEDLTVACASFTTDCEPDPDWDEDDEDEDEGPEHDG
ncbi:hypothetical protein [Kitasatospora sp. NPDC088783]|uniref:hypothetical protein n=1 Tax=Kitasatospora sp. NPDC088783 TaxID=3364077 RepID=UPI00381CAB93